MGLILASSEWAASSSAADVWVHLNNIMPDDKDTFSTLEVEADTDTKEVGNSKTGSKYVVGVNIWCLFSRIENI